MITIKKYGFILLLFALFSNSFGQKKRDKSFFLINLDESSLNAYDKYLIDSLLPIYHKTKNDTVKLNCIKGLAATLSDANIWVAYNDVLIDLTKNKSDSLSIAFYSDALNNTGYQYQYLKNNLDSAIYYYNLSYEISNKIQFFSAMGVALNNLAFIYQHRGAIEKSIELYSEAYKIFLKREYYAGITSTLVNLGDIYYRNEDFSKAEDNFQKALYYAEKIPGGFQLGNVYNQLAIINQHKNNLSKSFYYLYKAEKVYASQSDFSHLALTYINLANNHSMLKEKSISDSYFNKAAECINKIQEVSIKSRVLTELSGYYIGKNNAALAQQFADSGLYYAKKIGYPQLMYNAYIKLSEIYRHQKKFEQAFTCLKEANILNDSISNDKIKKSILKQQFKSDYEKKEIELKAEQTKKDTERKAEKKRQQYILYGTLVVLAALLVVIYVVYRNYASKKKSALVLEEKNKIIYSQKQLVEEKQKEIIDSINYAQKIQAAVLTGDEIWKKISKEYFILFQPKDIVSGDFYWAYNTVNSRAVFALADCTGHGVPGGFMSMLGNSFLNELVVENKIFNPAELLNKLRTKIISSLEQKGVTDRRDGMDMAICTWNKLNNTLEFAGANNKLWIIRSGSLVEYAGDKMPVGNYHGELKPFTLHEIKLEPGDQIVLSTDGFADQFGGEGSKKLMTKNLKSFIVNNSNLMLQQQRELLHNFLQEWKGHNEQVDDVSVISIKVL